MKQIEPPTGSSESEWDWLQKPWPWGQLAWIQLCLSFHLSLINDGRALKALSRSELIEQFVPIFGLSGLMTGGFALWKSWRLNQVGRTLPTYKWANQALLILGFCIVIRIASGPGRGFQNPAPPAIDGKSTAQTISDKKAILRTKDSGFEVEIPQSWIEPTPNRMQPYDVSRSDRSGRFGVGLFSEPRKGPPLSNAAEFGRAHFEAFSKPFDRVTLLDSTVSLRPGRPPLQQIVETVHGGVRTTFILAYQESGKAFVQLSVWGPPDEVETLRMIHRSVWESLREVRY